jgi:hypothetical protein
MRKYLKIIATSTFACAALLSFGGSEQAQAQARTRLYVSPTYYYNRAQSELGLSWYVVRAYYAGGPWCRVGTGVFGGGGVFGGNWSCYSGWPDYKQRNGLVCDPGTEIKGGDGILYVCQ